MAIMARMHRPNHTNIVHDRTQAWQQLGNLRATFTVLTEFKIGALERLCRAFNKAKTNIALISFPI